MSSVILSTCLQLQPITLTAIKLAINHSYLVVCKSLQFKLSKFLARDKPKAFLCRFRKIREQKALGRHPGFVYLRWLQQKQKVDPMADRKQFFHILTGLK